MGKHIHGQYGTPTYNVWRTMRQRCLNPRCNVYEYYGGRGITVCKRWDSFAAFLEDMGECPKGLTLDRYPDKDGHYEPGNCRWATRTEQARNTRRNRMVTLNGKTMCLAAWAEEYGLSARIVCTRIYTQKWSIERALTTPLRKWGES